MSASARFAGALRSRGLALFAEVVWVGLLVALSSLPVVTALPAAAAGAARLRRHIAGEDDALNGFVRDLGSALRRGWLAGAIAAAVGFALVVNTTAPMMAAVPGGEALRLVSIAAAVVLGTVALRVAAMWHPDAGWRLLLRTAAARTASDLRGTAMLVLAIVLAATIVWMFAPLVVLAPGLLLFAAVAVSPKP